jgi:hypothetical protein
VALESIFEASGQNTSNSSIAKPLLAGMVELGIHPTDETGAKPISNTEWSELFNLIDDKVEWNTTDNSQLRKAKDAAAKCDSSTLAKVGKVSLGLAVVAGAAYAGYYYANNYSGRNTTIIINGGDED